MSSSKVKLTHKFGWEVMRLHDFMKENGIDLSYQQMEELKSGKTVVVKTFLGETGVQCFNQ